MHQAYNLSSCYSLGSHSLTTCCPASEDEGQKNLSVYIQNDLVSLSSLEVRTVNQQEVFVESHFP